MKTEINIIQGGVYFCDLWGSIGSEEGKQRPCLVIQNDRGNEASPTTIILPISKKKQKYYFQHTLYKEKYNFFDCEENTVLCEQPRCIDNKRIIKFLGAIDDKDYQEIYIKYCNNCKR